MATRSPWGNYQFPASYLYIYYEHPQGVRGSRMGGCVVLTGRAKDTIVLASGENIEPQPIEDALCVSPLIKFATVIGQDCKHLGALIVTDPDALAEAAKAQGAFDFSTAVQNSL